MVGKTELRAVNVGVEVRTPLEKVVREVTTKIDGETRWWAVARYAGIVKWLKVKDERLQPGDTTIR